MNTPDDPIRAANAILGHWGPTYEFPLERGKALEFAEATFLDHPMCVEDPRGPIPLTFLSVAGYRWGYMLEHPRDSPFATIKEQWVNSIDGGQAFAWRNAPARIGDLLLVRSRLVEALPKPSRRYGKVHIYRTETEYSTPKGDTVAVTTTSSILPQGLEPMPCSSDRAGRLRRIESDHAGATNALGRLRQLVSHQAPPSVTLPPLSRTDIARYQFAVGDPAPFHHDAGHALAVGLPDVMSMGMLQAGTMVSYLMNWLGPAGLRSFSVRFLEPVWPGDILQLSLDGTRQLIAQTERDDQTCRSWTCAIGNFA